jgi:hypothetical protein
MSGGLRMISKYIIPEQRPVQPAPGPPAPAIKPEPVLPAEASEFVLEAEPGHFSITGNDAKFRLTDAQVTTISSSANTKFEAVAFEMSKRIETIANTVSDVE